MARRSPGDPTMTTENDTTETQTSATSKPPRVHRTKAATTGASAYPPRLVAISKSDTVIKLLLRTRGATPLELIAGDRLAGAQRPSVPLGGCARRDGRSHARRGRTARSLTGSLSHLHPPHSRSRSSRRTTATSPRPIRRTPEMSGLADDLAGLATMSPAQLRSEWRRVYPHLAAAADP